MEWIEMIEFFWTWIQLIGLIIFVGSAVLIAGAAVAFPVAWLLDRWFFK